MAKKRKTAKEILDEVLKNKTAAKQEKDTFSPGKTKTSITKTAPPAPIRTNVEPPTKSSFGVQAPSTTTPGVQPQTRASFGVEPTSPMGWVSNYNERLQAFNEQRRRNSLAITAGRADAKAALPSQRVRKAITPSIPQMGTAPSEAKGMFDDIMLPKKAEELTKDSRNFALSAGKAEAGKIVAHEEGIKKLKEIPEAGIEAIGAGTEDLVRGVSAEVTDLYGKIVPGGGKAAKEGVKLESQYKNRLIVYDKSGKAVVYKPELAKFGEYYIRKKGDNFWDVSKLVPFNPNEITAENFEQFEFPMLGTSWGKKDSEYATYEELKPAMEQALAGEEVVRERYVPKDYSDNLAAQVAQSIGYQVPTRVAGLLGGTAGMGVAAYFQGRASGTRDAIAKGATYEQIQAAGRAEGIIQAGTEMLFGGLGKAFGKGALDDVAIGKASQYFKTAIGKNLAQLGLRAAGEGLVEEPLAAVLSAAAQNAIYRKDDDYLSLLKEQDIPKQMLLAVLTTGVMNSGGFIKSTIQGVDMQYQITPQEYKALSSTLKDYNQQIKDINKMSPEQRKEQGYPEKPQPTLTFDDMAGQFKVNSAIQIIDGLSPGRDITMPTDATAKMNKLNIDYEPLNPIARQFIDRNKPILEKLDNRPDTRTAVSMAINFEKTTGIPVNIYSAKEYGEQVGLSASSAKNYSGHMVRNAEGTPTSLNINAGATNAALLKTIGHQLLYFTKDTSSGTEIRTMVKQAIVDKGNYDEEVSRVSKLYAQQMKQDPENLTEAVEEEIIADYVGEVLYSNPDTLTKGLLKLPQAEVSGIKGLILSIAERLPTNSNEQRLYNKIITTLDTAITQQTEVLNQQRQRTTVEEKALEVDKTAVPTLDLEDIDGQETTIADIQQKFDTNEDVQYTVMDRAAPGYIFPDGQRYITTQGRTLSETSGYVGRVRLGTLVTGGAITVDPGNGDIDIGSAPNAKQYETIRTVLADIQRNKMADQVLVNLAFPDGSITAAQTYAADTDPEAILNDIRSFYDTGKLQPDTLLGKVGKDAPYQGSLVAGNKRKAALEEAKNSVEAIRAEQPELTKEEAKLADKERREKFRTKRAEAVKKASDLVVESLSTWKDPFGRVALDINTMQRNLYKVIPDKALAEQVYNAYFLPIKVHTAMRQTFLKNILNDLDAIKLNKYEDAYGQMLGEFEAATNGKGKSTLTQENMDDYLNAHKDKINLDTVREAVKAYRKAYELLYDEINKVNDELGYERMPYIDGYFPHFIADNYNTVPARIARIIGLKQHIEHSPVSLSEMRGEDVPSRLYSPFFKKRTGDDTAYSLKEGMDKYLSFAADHIFYSEDIVNLRALEEAILTATSTAEIKKQIKREAKRDDIPSHIIEDKIAEIYRKSSTKLPMFTAELTKYTDFMAKKVLSGRRMQERFGTFGQEAFQNILRRTRANLIAMNLGAAMSQAAAIPQLLARTNIQSTLDGIAMASVSGLYSDFVSENSTFLISRTKHLTALNRSVADKLSDWASLPFKVVDDWTANVVVRGAYSFYTKQGFSPQEALKKADEFANSAMAGRGRGDMPMVFYSQNPLVQTLTMFQLEAKNYFDFAVKDLKRYAQEDSELAKSKDGGEPQKELTALFVQMLMKLWLSSAMFNFLFNKIWGRTILPDPFTMGYHLLKTITNENLTNTEKITRATQTVVKEIPFVGTLLGGGRIAVVAAAPDFAELARAFGEITSGDEEKQKIAANRLIEQLVVKPIAYQGLPFAGSFVKKELDVIRAYSKDIPGSYSPTGQLRFEVPDTFAGKVQTVLGGVYASKSAQDYFENMPKTITKEQQEVMKKTGLSAVEFREYRAGIKDLKEAEDKIKYISKLDYSSKVKNELIKDATNLKTYVDIDKYMEIGDLEAYKIMQDNPAKYELIKAMAPDYKTWKRISKEWEDIRWRYDNTKDRKEALLLLLRQQNLTDAQQALFMKSIYKSYEENDDLILRYLNTVPDKYRNDIGRELSLFGTGEEE